MSTLKKKSDATGKTLSTASRSVIRGFDFLPAKNGSISTSALAPTTVPQTPSRSLNALEQAILDEMASDAVEEWTSKSVVTALRSGDAYRLADSADVAMNAVTLALASLKELGKIKRVHEGRGRDPHRYKITAAIEKEATPEEIAS